MTTSATVEQPATDTVSAENPALTLASLLVEAKKAKADQPWYQRPDKSNHNQKPARPPHGTRRSMGKR